MGISFTEKVSVIIPNYNYARYVDQAIESVLNQTYKNIELIVVNNGSTDDSLEVVSKYSDRIKLINQDNLGQSGSRNSGLRAVTGNLIAFLDADDFWEKDKIEKQLLLISEEVQLVYCGVSTFRESGIQIVDFLSPKYRGDCHDYFIQVPGGSIVLSGESTALFSTTLLNKVGLFDEELNSAAGWDFFRRCSKFTDFDFTDEFLTHYRLHDSNMSNSSVNTIRDMRKAYNKMFHDTDWQISTTQEDNLRRALEYTYLKTHIKNLNLKLAINSIIKLIR